MSISAEFEKVFRENLGRIMKENPIPEPPVREQIGNYNYPHSGYKTGITVDLVSFQMKDMEERVEYLEKQIQENEFESKNDPEYKRIMEYCVRFAVDLDNINIVGRDEERAKRRDLLARLDGVSGTLLKKCK